jgi:hypothetical protein
LVGLGKIMKELTKEQQKELEILAAEIEAEAIQMKVDYEQNPSEESGSVVMVHENSEWLNIAQDLDESDKDKPIVWDDEE